MTNEDAAKLIDLIDDLLQDEEKRWREDVANGDDVDAADTRQVIDLWLRLRDHLEAMT